MRSLAPKALVVIGIVLLLPLGGILLIELLLGTTNLAVVAPAVGVGFAVATLAGFAALGAGLTILVFCRSRGRLNS